jgi:hypothetical protein
MNRGILCRSIFYPKCARSGVFDELALLQLVDIHNNKSVYGLSLASRYLLRDEDGAHRYGRDTAVRMNEAYETRVGAPPSPEKKTVYLGFYDAPNESLKKVSLEYYELRIKHLVEHGERAHFQLELQDRGLLGTGKSNDKLRRDDRTVAMMKVLSFLSGPRRFSNEGNEVPDDFELPVLPKSNGNSLDSATIA